MNKKQAHHEAFGYEPLRMKPAHFASGFFVALTDRTYPNELLNKVAVTKTTRGLLEDYAPEAVVERLRQESRIWPGRWRKCQAPGVGGWWNSGTNSVPRLFHGNRHDVPRTFHGVCGVILALPRPLRNVA